MQIHYHPGGTDSDLAQSIETVSRFEGVQSLAVFSCDANAIAADRIGSVLQSVEQPLFGGLFPALIHDGRMKETGHLVLGLPFAVEPFIVHNLSAPDADFEHALTEILPAVDACPTAMVLVDGMATRIGGFIDEIFATFGLEMNYIGGGAGSLDMVSKPCLFTNQGVFQDCALMVAIPTISGIGVSHGWKSIQGPFKVTEATNNKIISLDWTPAFDVYRTVVESHSRRRFEDAKFHKLAASFPFGISKFSAEKVVREAITLDADGSLTCVGEVPQGSFVDVLTSDSERLIQAAGAALRQAESDFGPARKDAFTFFVDCVSRSFFLKDRYVEEIEQVNVADRPMAGICTLGEIANNGQDYLEFYNKTSVVAIMGLK